MSAFSDSYVSNVLFASPHRVAWRWRWMRASLFEPYRPELHYMRGPGPKWREKHGRHLAKLPPFIQPVSAEDLGLRAVAAALR